MNNGSIAGDYYLQGVRETASGFLLNPDGSFQFFFSYGALDRYGSGTWVFDNGEIKLNSLAKPLYDFALVESGQTSEENITIRIRDNNPNILRFVYASLQKEDIDSWLPANQDGLIKFPKQELKSITLQFEFCPERVSDFAIKEKDDNDFTFRIEPWIMEVFLVDLTLRPDNDGLIGKHPLLEGSSFSYIKQ